jgi:hypothetical protein
MSQYDGDKDKGTCPTTVLGVIPRLPNLDKHKSGSHHVRPYTLCRLHALLSMLKHRICFQSNVEPAFELGRQLLRITEGHLALAKKPPLRRPTNMNTASKPRDNAPPPLPPLPRGLPPFPLEIPPRANVHDARNGVSVMLD